MSEKIIKIKTKLDYDNGYNSNRISSNIFKISPSSFETFFSKPHLWFQQMFLNENKFEGNTASYLGTTVHFLAHQYFINNKITDNDYNEIIQYLENASDNPEVDPNIVESEMDTLFELTTNFIDNSEILLSEEYLSAQLTNNVILAGSCDYTKINPEINNKNSIIVGDFKTTRVKLLPKKIAYNHRLQLYCYAYMLIQRGYVVNTIEITYIKRNIDGEVSAKTGKTGKVYPPELLTLTEPFTAENYTFIKSLLMLCAETFEEFLKQPNLAYLFYKDYRYKNKTFDISKFKEQESEF